VPATVPDASPSARAGFAAVEFNSLNHSTSYNSSGGAIGVTHSSAGLYTVTFFGQSGFVGGDVQVSTLSPVGTCSVDSWGVSAGDLNIGVDCYNLSGALNDEDFSVLATQPLAAPHAPAGVLDYDWVYTSHGVLTGIYQFNSSHRRNSVRHLGTGRYLVSMPGPGTVGATKGTVKVTAYGAGPGGCQVVSWRTVSTGELVGVACFGLGGVPGDRDFTIAYARGNNLMGQNGKETANALAVGTRTLYQPTVQFDSRPGARVSVLHLDRGIYEVIYVGTNPTGHFNGGLGDAQLTAVGTTYRHCGIALAPSHTPIAIVTCLDGHGNRVNTAFTAQVVFN
jgi:hypothetical protein